MPRLSKRRRDAARFGEPERLADIIIGTEPKDWRLAAGTQMEPADVAAHQRWIDEFRGWVADSPVIVADNVAEFFYRHEQQDWRYDQDFPNLAPLFDQFFVEYHYPSRVLTREGWSENPLPGASIRHGLLLEYRELNKSFGLAAKPYRLANGGLLDLSGFRKAKWAVNAIHVSCAFGRPTYLSIVHVFGVDESGQIVVDPFPIGGVQRDNFEMLANAFGEIMSAGLLAVCFAHCKNVETVPHDPPAHFNRERRKAGMRPFVRYHTIEIEPMRRVLRAEGGIEEHGLKRALHICRGHFATYSTKLFGRELDKPVTVWKPAHVRGTAESGVVVSDYRVSP